MRVVAAVGGNALLRRGEPPEAEIQRRNVEVAAGSLAGLAREHDLVVVHGNGPQVGLLALQSEAYQEVPSYPFDVLGAESEGMVGYLLDQALENELPGRPVAALLTQVVVDLDDPAFSNPTKFVGPVYDQAAAEGLAGSRGWTVARDGDGWRRVVPSPDPQQIMELATIDLLVGYGVIVICAGGGGIPVAVDSTGRVRGVEAVIDKDLAAALLASRLGADALLMLTDVAAVEVDHGTAAARPLREVTPAELRAVDLPAGSMGPKAEAACRFVEAGGKLAAIGALDQAEQLLPGDVGTIVRAAPLPTGHGQRA